ncbi:MAG: hypothetical protein K0S28_1427 [Paucimonas sp.]|jgi:hypothetical protein|nr:hypothetical protein [Paucimonas sp.]
MAAMTYFKANWIAEADIQRLQGGAYQGVVLIKSRDGGDDDVSEHAVGAFSDTPDEALEEAKALAHRLLGDLE